MSNGTSNDMSNVAPLIKSIPKSYSQAAQATHIYTYNKTRFGYNDIILTCNLENDDSKAPEVHKFMVEKAVLACHSTVFADMVDKVEESDDESDDESEDEILPSIPLSEPPGIIDTILKILYHTTSYMQANDNNGESFDHWVDVIEVADMYCMDMVIDRALLYLCCSFKSFIEEGKSGNFDTTRYGKAAILKFLIVFRRAYKGEWDISSFSMQEFQVICTGQWDRYCGLIITTASNLDQKFVSAPFLDSFVTEESLSFFTKAEIYAFSNVLQRCVAISDGFHFYEVVKEHFFEKKILES